MLTLGQVGSVGLGQHAPSACIVTRLTLQAWVSYLRLVLDQADDTVFGRRGLAIDCTPNHVGVNVRVLQREPKLVFRVIVIAYLVMRTM